MQYYFLAAPVVGYILTLSVFALLAHRLSTQRWRLIARRSTRVLALYPLGVIILSGIHFVLPQRNGLLAVTQVIAPYLFLPCLLAVPFALTRYAGWLRWSLVACLILFGLRFMLPILHAPTINKTSTPPITVLNWNVAVSNEEDQRMRLQSVLRSRPADIVVLEEAYWEWLRRDPVIARLYPYQINHTREASSGLVLLSSYPFTEAAGADRRPGIRGWPRMIWAEIRINPQQQLLVVAGHTESPYSSLASCRSLLCYDTTERDSLIPRVRARVDSALQQGKPVLLIGDFNVTDREPMYQELSAGLTDFHRQVGQGFGHTWGLIPELPWWHTPLLRIEYLLSSPNIIPLRSFVDCTPHGSDHCIVLGEFAFRSN